MSIVNTMPDSAQFQASLKEYVLIYTPDYLPLWLIIAGVLFVGMLLVLALHGFLRYRFATPHGQSHQEEKLYLYSKAVRLWHWSNASLFILLLVSGGINHFALLSTHDTALLVSVHEICGYLLLVCWLSFVFINLVGGNGKFYRIDSKNWFQRAFMQTRFYLYGIIKGEDHPFPATPNVKFNPLQQMAYLGVMYALVPLLLITGVLLQNPTFIPADAVMFKAWLLIAHQILAVCSVFFIIGHLYLCTTGRTPFQTFRSMVDGYHRH
ncbi:thiosulfate reductase cytochrome B subunit [Proteus vulgaris]|uniref:thiosulfate reductase cytochrome B subunit n=1 Tax=Proteus vulgaris TaxID=585 RepID=UPI000F502224|nr:thiosulfate reductase cytochrome B subunit [Proteus vulgaris]AYY79517.1 thiosulfate reductase cytochrome B subunit [Proteus vulgaris]MBW3471151.1 thiosulfate reductase cytochrome B subunit [Proteus vulgaris]